MRIKLTLWSVIVAAAATAMGAGGLGFHTYNLPPAHRLHAPGPGVGGPGPGVLPPAMPYALGVGVVRQNSVQVLFNRPEGMQVRWDVTGVAQFDSNPLVLPGRKNFPEGGIYRLKLTNIVSREGVELYPTLELAPITPRTAAYLAHNAIPIQFTEEDLDQVMSGNFVTKVIYLPDPEFQELALASVETLVSNRLDPGEDPIVEADRRGSIMAVVRVGNKDIEMGNPYADGGPVMAANFQDGNAPAVGPQVANPGALPPSGGAPPTQPYSGAPAALAPTALGPTGIAPPYVSGITSPQYGMPMSGTPIGLPGPPHIPFGAPVGLNKHVMRNHTRMHLPQPTERMQIHVRQRPGFSYPKPPSSVRIREQMIHPSQPFSQPGWDRTEIVH